MIFIFLLLTTLVLRAEKTAEQIQHESKERDKVTSLLQSLTSDGMAFEVVYFFVIAIKKDYKSCSIF